jgi:hypothetical protein
MRIDRKLIHPSVLWFLVGHPEAMKMSCRQGYFCTRLRRKVAFSDVRLTPSLRSSRNDSSLTLVD